MRVRLKLIAAVGGALLLVVPGVILAGGPGGGGGGGGNVVTVVAGSAVAAVPQVAGNYHGSYSYQVLGVGLVAPPNNHEVLMFVNQSKDKLTGTFCLGAVSPGCFQVKGNVKAPSAVSIQFDAIATPFFLDGTVGDMFCLDGSAGKVISGGFHVREGSGGFSFNNCP
jgi:hypothetical protein